MPGEFPYTRGIHKNMYRGRLWTMRQFAGFGSADDTNNRFDVQARNLTDAMMYCSLNTCKEHRSKLSDVEAAKIIQAI